MSTDSLLAETNESKTSDLRIFFAFFHSPNWHYALPILYFQLLWFVVYVTIAALISVSLLLFGLLFAAAW